MLTLYAALLHDPLTPGGPQEYQHVAHQSFLACCCCDDDGHALLMCGCLLPCAGLQQ
jgi:hypothetical protein